MSPKYPFPPAVSSAPDFIQRGVRLHDGGKFAEALAHFERALQRRPDHPLALWHYGRALIMLQQARRAVPFLEKAVALLPPAAGPHFDLGSAYGDALRTEESVASFRAAIALRPDWANAWSRLGRALTKATHYAEAETVLRHALTLSGHRDDTLNHLGLLAKALDRHDEAVEFFLEAIRLQPRFVEAWNHLGNTLAAQNKLDEALFAYQRSMALEPTNAAVKFNLAIVRLRQGTFNRDTWLKYEFRWVAIQQSPQRSFTQPIWRGDETLAGKSILLYAEQGLGDTLQFARFAAVLAARGATVHVEVQKGLKALMQDLPGATSVIAHGEPLPPFDFYCPLMSVPFALDTRLDSIPAGEPYVHAAPDRVEQWQTRLPARGPLRVGVVWRGNPKHNNDANRSIAFALFRRIFAAEGCTFVGLQVELTAEESATFAGTANCVNPADRIKDFADTAAIIAQLDLVVAVDTSVAHLAGALGVPVWLLLPFSPDWRWMLEREDNPWYPTMRLFRQPAIGDWDSVLGRLADELPAAASTSRHYDTQAALLAG